jgi:hypothetical protein
MGRCLVIIVTVALIVAILWGVKASREGFWANNNGTNVPAYSLYVTIPPDANSKPYGYTSYTPEQLKDLCPTATGAGKWCKDHNDCPGQAELCFNSAGYVVSEGKENPQPESNYCVCSIQNDCMELGIC